MGTLGPLVGPTSSAEMLGVAGARVSAYGDGGSNVSGLPAAMNSRSASKSASVLATTDAVVLTGYRVISVRVDRKGAGG